MKWESQKESENTRLIFRKYSEIPELRNLGNQRVREKVIERWEIKREKENEREERERENQREKYMERESECTGRESMYKGTRV